MQDRATNIGRDWSLLIIDGFDDFTPIQLELMRLISGRAAETVITVTQSETADFRRFEETRKEIEDELGVTGQPLPDFEGPKERVPALAGLTTTLFSQTPETVPEGHQAVYMIEAADRTAEVRAGLRWLKERIVRDGMRPDEVALLARSTDPYRPFVRQIAAEFGLPIRFIDGLPLAQNPLISALLNLLRLHLPTAQDNKPELSRRMIVSAWRSPYFRLDFIEPGDADTLDSIARQQRVIRGLVQWQEAFNAQSHIADGAPSELESDEEVPTLNQPTGSQARNLQQKFHRFLDLIRPPKGAGTMCDFVGWLEERIGPDPAASSSYPASPDSLQITSRARENAETAVPDIAALQLLKEILRGFVWAEEALGQSKVVDYVYFFNELSGAINAAYYTLPVSKEKAEIMVADVIRVRGLPFRAVALMGLSEGEFPAVISEDPFLRDADRKTFREEFEFILKPSTLSGEREFFYESVGRPTERLLLTRPTLADNGAAWPPSPFWEAVYEAIGQPQLPDVFSSESLIPVESAASWVEYWQSLAAVVVPEQTVAEPENWQRIKQAADIVQNRQLKTATDFDGFLPQLAAQLGQDYGPDHTWSASRLETYQRCGYFFFIQNVLYLRARLEPAEGLDVTQLGSVYHHLFEAVYKAGLPEELDAVTILAFVAAVAKPILDAAPHKEGFRETPWWSQTRQEMIENVAESVLALEEGGFTFFESEAAFGFDETPKLLFDSPSGPLQLRGFIDRVDRDENGRLRIIDYKLGGPSQFSKRAFEEGKKLQLPLYALAAQQTLGLGAVTEGFYWHFHQGRNSYFTLSKADGGVEGAIETAVNHAAHAVELIRNGRFIPKPPDGGCPSYCPAAAFCWHYSPAAY
jgi:ATP-dependent helicase/DNAse subunit B